jgi:hypothetical protein
MFKNSVHPCFSCTLPDCDDENRRCGLRRAIANYRSCLDRKTPIPPEVRQARNIAYMEIYGDRHRELSAQRYQRNKQSGLAVDAEAK